MYSLRMLGPWWIVMGAAFAVALVIPLVLGVLTAFRFRVPAFLWMVGPTFVLLAGLPAAVSGGTQLLAALAYVDPQHRSVLAAAGYAEAVVGPLLASFQASAALLFGAVALAVGSAVGAGSARLTLAPAGASLAVVAVGAFGTGLWALLAYESVPLLMLPAVGFVAGLAAAGGGLRLGEAPEDAARGAAARMTLALLAVSAVVLAAVGVSLVLRVGVYQTISWSGTQELTLVAMGLRALTNLGGVAVVTTGWVIVAAAIPAVAAAPQLGRDARTALGAVGSVVVVAVGAAALGGVTSWLSSFVTPSSGLLQAARWARDLPLVTQGSTALTGQCFVTPKARGWHVRAVQDGVACAEGDLQLPIAWDPPLVAVPAEMPAHLLASTAWYGPQGGRLHLLVRTGAEIPEGSPLMLEAYAYGFLPIDWVAPGQPSPGSWRLVDAAEGTVAEINGAANPIDPAHLLAEVQELTRIYGKPDLVPGQGWSAQDLAAICGALREVTNDWDDVGCLLQAAP